MRFVVDTNVLISALMHPGRTPDRALKSVLDGSHIVLLDARIDREYREVLARKKFAAIDRTAIDLLLKRIERWSERIDSTRGRDEGGEIVRSMVDLDDRMFVEVALEGRAHAIVTGNVRHFPRELPIAVWPPAEVLTHLNGVPDREPPV